MQIPQNNMYDPLYVRGMAVLVPHLPENVAALQEFIYGPEEESDDDLAGTMDLPEGVQRE